MILFFSLLKTMSVFLVVGYVYCKSPWFRPLTGEQLTLRDKIHLYFFFSSLSILGSYLGHPIQDALANTRAIGPVLAGLIGGPVLGTAVGFTGGLHRFTLGGFTALSCGLSTTVEGCIGGLIHLWLFRRQRSEGMFSPAIALVTTAGAEVVQMIIILLVSRPFADALALVKVIAFPMIFTSSLGCALFMSIIRDQRNMHDKTAAIFSAHALKIAERTLNILRSGFNRNTARDLARIIQEETNVSAVAITDRDSVLAFTGMGADHHRVGDPISSDLTKRVIAGNTVIYADGIRDQFRCSVSPTCPLNSALVLPLTIDDEVIGTIKLYESGDKRFLFMNRSLGEGIARLLSNQLLLSRYEEQKNLLMMAELKLLHAQVNPHFLFNAINTIVAIVRTDADRARELLIQLANFFRQNLKRNTGLSTLEEELAHVNSYLEIEKARFEGRFRVETDVDPTLLALKIPTFTLQPLIENAIKHGISHMLEPGVARIRAQHDNNVALIEIEDNAGMFCENGNHDGLGIRIVDRRLKSFMGPHCGAIVSCTPHEFTRVSIRIPLQDNQV
ncbi:sensor histidine kinase [Desulfomonile tiedjei]|uniref:histidine kinase n=1 Tax=Desulfomonile tiedjei (strain ATCC 49306 / DSM 6799 / DCB-1) TaxID=706587 RepID=I4C2W8_DESTA|nr:sensor histidine kinase [Desulfomonile tiedjei]AFM23909.1 putative regulator of cell autolysis [Desulfomonile tiedjei DSM 6799]